jgi:pimeloyl-ACP methyl ester carboxylesterase
MGVPADLVDRPFHYHDMAEDTVALMGQLGIESAVVVGYSDGGIIGLDLAIHHPERVTKLAATGAKCPLRRLHHRESEMGTQLRSRNSACFRRLRASIARRGKALACRSRTSESDVGR